MFVCGMRPANIMAKFKYQARRKPSLIFELSHDISGLMPQTNMGTLLSYKPRF